ncbi:MAG: hypothetical protein JWQ84_1123 [Mucilaginibacter sp.]|jgi:hypothetical protein|nr:hypothetical protein [Mucilaginibacter sp.]
MYKLLKPVLCILFVMAIGYNSFGQYRMRVVPRREPIERFNKPNNPGRRMELVKEGYINRQLKLTTDEAKSFWPVYHQYVQDQTAVRILKRQNNSNNSPNGTQQIDKELDYEAQLVEIRKHYKDEFLKILPAEKVSELYKSERQFNDEVLKQLSERSVRAGD